MNGTKTKLCDDCWKLSRYGKNKEKRDIYKKGFIPNPN